LYRLKSISEFLEIGGIEYLSNKNGICIIEWPELLNTFDVDNKIEIKFELIDDNKRKIDIIK
jgi:tRNA threonylcarbamoyladenosine biosynthesis protein TsaE